MTGFHDLLNSRPSSWSQHQNATQSPPWCSGPRNRVQRWRLWCPAVGGGAPYWSYALPMPTCLAMRGRCADGVVSPDAKCRECCTHQDFSVPGCPSNVDRNRDIPRAQAGTMLCPDSILLLWLKAVWMQGRKVTEVESSKGWVKSLHLKVEVLMDMMKFWVWSYSFDTLQSGSWLAIYQRNLQALSSSKTLWITYTNTWRHNLEHHNRKISYTLLL
jgi:hypothetical protein